MSKMIFVVSEVGYTWEEVIVPYIEFKKYGFSIDFATITGEKPKLDPLSTVVKPLMSYMGYGISKKIAVTTDIGKELLEKLNKPMSIEAIDVNNFDGIFLAGGHGSLFDMNKSQKLHTVIENFNNKNKQIVAICHASSTLAFVQVNGQSLIKDKRVTGFPTLMEHFILTFKMVHTDFLPLPIWTGKELNKHSNKRSIGIKLLELLNTGYAIKDGNIITGVGPKAGKNVVKKMMAK